MRNYSDPTANAAIGAVDREFRNKQKLAKTYKELWHKCLLSDEKLVQIEKQFTGIFTHIYDEIFDE